MRPIIRPARNTETKMKTSIVYRPLPMPPKITSPMCMLNRSMKPAMGIMESCWQLLAPSAVIVTLLAHVAEL